MRTGDERAFTPREAQHAVDQGDELGGIGDRGRPSTVSDLYAFEVPSSTEWAFQRIAPGFRPSVFVDISTELDRKVAAMECYRSERRPTPHPRSPEMLRAAAYRWGSVAGMAAAEAFELIRSLRTRHR